VARKEDPVPEQEESGWARSLDWRIWFGLTLTASYIAYGVYHILVDVGWTSFSEQPLESQGSFLEGAFAPLAFLWLVIGYFLQHKALQENNRNILLQYREMRRAGEHAAIQAAALTAAERHARQESFLRMSELVDNQLGVTAGLLYFANPRSVQGAFAPATAQEPSGELWSRLSDGDSGVFARLLMEMCYGPAGRRRDQWRIFFGTGVRERYTRQFLRTFEDLLNAARETDSSGMMTQAVVMGTANGHLYRTIMEYAQERGKSPKEPAEPGASAAPAGVAGSPDGQGGNPGG
jgi:hypothetical protein